MMISDYTLDMSKMIRIGSFAFSGFPEQTSPSEQLNDSNSSEQKKSSSSSKKRKMLPKKIMLSPNKRMLLIHGCYHNGIPSLVIFQIREDGPPFFDVLFHDLSFSYLDACFSQGNHSLVAIFRRFPSHVFSVIIPRIPSPATGILADPMLFSPTPSMDMKLTGLLQQQQQVVF